MPNIVPGYGPRDAKIMIVGEAPAANEVRIGRPFQGPAGQELRKLLASASINYDECYITNASLTPVENPDRKQAHFFGKDGLTDDFKVSYVQLIRDMNEIKPNVVIALGGYALWATTGLHTGKAPGSGIMDYRGSILQNPFTQTKVVPTIHPAALLRGKNDYEAGKVQGGLWKYRTVVIWDLQKAKKQSAFPEMRLRPRNLLVDPSYEEREMAIKRLLAAKVLVFDIETHGGTKLACIGFSDGDPEWSVTFPYDGGNNHDLFKMLLESDIPKVGQNLMYDVTMLDQIGIHTKNIVFDTMLAQHVLLVEMPKGLDFLASIYTDMPFYKHEGKVWKEEHDINALMTFWKYNAKDVCATTESWREQERELKESNLWNVFQREMRVFEPMRWATFNGIDIDQTEMDSMIEATKVRALDARLKLDKEFGEDFNPNSPKQVATALFDVKRLPRRVSTDARTLHDIAAKTGDKSVLNILEYRQATKLLSTNLNKGIISRDGRIRSNYNIGGTVSGRLSSDAPLWGVGINGQNVPPKQRKLFKPRPGFEFAEFDQSQAEAIIVAYLANDPVHIDCFRHGKDVHRVTMCLIEGMPLDQWASIPKTHPRRDLYKRGNHSFNYNVGPDTFMMIVNNEADPDDPNAIVLDQKSSRKFHELYLQNRPALPGWWESIRQELRRDRTLTTPLGRMRVFLDAWSDSLLKEAYSYKPQSTIGDQTNMAISNIYYDDDMRRLGVQVVGQVHDSMWLTWPISNRDEVMKRIWGLCEYELYINGYRVIVPWEGYVGQHFYKNEMEDLGKSRKVCEVGY